MPKGATYGRFFVHYGSVDDERLTDLTMKVNPPIKELIS